MSIKAAERWTTTQDGQILGARERCTLRRGGKRTGAGIVVDTEAARQPFLGFGGMFNDSAIYHLMRMTAGKRTAALKDLFDPRGEGAWNLMRIAFGSTDWDRDWNFYTYDDMPPGKRDLKLARFSVEEDRRRGHFQVIREAMAINPELQIFASVWSPPAWMKDTGTLISYGTIPPKHYGVYARYLRKAIEAYEAEGIPILSVSPQNEPLCNDGRKTPQGLWMKWLPMRDFLVVLDEEFRRHGIKTQIWAHDHNFCYTRDWVRPLVRDRRMRGVIDGVAWHDYEGDASEMGKLAAEFPELPMYHTEHNQYTAVGISRLIAMLRNGARSHNHWTTIQDEYGAPHQFKGGSELIKEPRQEENLPALVSPREDASKYRRSTGYYMSGQVSRVVRRGAVRLETRGGGALSHTAFRNPDGTIAVIVANTQQKGRRTEIRVKDAVAACEVPAMAVTTCVLW